MREKRREGLNETQVNLGSKPKESKKTKEGTLNQDGANPGLAANLLYGLAIH